MLKKSGSTATDTALGSGRLPKSQAERQRVAEVIGQDGSNLLTQIFDPASPYDPEARLGKKRSTMWTGDIRSSERDL
jgi:hypothetical protein